MTPRVFWWNYPTLEQKITFCQCRKFLRALSSFAPAYRGGQVYASLREEKRIARKDAKPQRPPEGRQARWNHASLEMIKNQLKVWVNPKAKLHCIKVHSLGD